MTRFRWMSRRAGMAATLALVAAFAAVRACSAAQEPDVRYEPSPPAVVERMLEMADAASADVLYDLGSGDGRIVIAAARDFGVERAIGVEIDAELIERSRENARAAGVAERTRFVEADLFTHDFSDADALTLFLLPRLNLRLRPRLLAELEPGTHVVSHEHEMGDWRPDASVRVDGHAIHLWVIPARLEGRWSWESNGERRELRLQQQYQDVAGLLLAGERRAVIERARLRGRQLRFTASVDEPGDTTRFTFEGRLEDGRLRGTLIEGDERGAVRARRID